MSSSDDLASANTLFPLYFPRDKFTLDFAPYGALARIDSPRISTYDLYLFVSRSIRDDSSSSVSPSRPLHFAKRASLFLRLDPLTIVYGPRGEFNDSHVDLSAARSLSLSLYLASLDRRANLCASQPGEGPSSVISLADPRSESQKARYARAAVAAPATLCVFYSRDTCERYTSAN